MAYFSAGVEYAIHCLTFLVNEKGDLYIASISELAEIQGVPQEYLAKVFTKLTKAGVVISMEGMKGGFKLAKPAEEITLLDITIAIDGNKELFECREIRERCAVFEGGVPDWAISGTCSIHAVMLTAQKRMEDVLSQSTILDIVRKVSRKAPTEFSEKIARWFKQKRQ